MAVEGIGIASFFAVMPAAKFHARRSSGWIELREAVIAPFVDQRVPDWKTLRREQIRLFRAHPDQHLAFWHGFIGQHWNKLVCPGAATDNELVSGVFPAVSPHTDTVVA